MKITKSKLIKIIKEEVDHFSFFEVVSSSENLLQSANVKFLKKHSSLKEAFKDYNQSLLLEGLIEDVLSPILKKYENSVDDLKVLQDLGQWPEITPGPKRPDVKGLSGSEKAEAFKEYNRSSKESKEKNKPKQEEIDRKVRLIKWASLMYGDEPKDHPPSEALPVVQSFLDKLPTMRDKYKSNEDFKKKVDELSSGTSNDPLEINRFTSDNMGEIIEAVEGKAGDIQGDKDQAQKDKIGETKNWEVFLPTTMASSCELGKGTTWCTARVRGNNLFYNYVGNPDESMVLFYVIKKNAGTPPKEHPTDYLSLGYREDGSKIEDYRYGGVNIDSDNEGITPEEFESIVGEQESREVYGIIDKRFKSLEEHPVKEKFRKATQSLEVFNSLFTKDQGTEEALMILDYVKQYGIEEERSGLSESVVSEEVKTAIQAIYTSLEKSGKLKKARLSRVNLEEANLKGADLAGTYMYGAKLREADLEGANLKGVNLEEAKLGGANLAGADLEGANLEEAYLGIANLKGANLKGAKLQRAYLDRANLVGANLEGAKLEGAKLREADLLKADLLKADLEGANLEEANLEGAYLDVAYLEGANLKGANLKGAKLQRASLDRANLEGVNLEGVNLVGAYLDGASLKGANLEGVNLEGAKLREADLEGANIKGANLEGAYLWRTKLGGANLKGANLPGGGAELLTPSLFKAEYNSQTQFPESFNPEEHGMVNTDVDQSQQQKTPLEEGEDLFESFTRKKVVQILFEEITKSEVKKISKKEAKKIKQEIEKSFEKKLRSKISKEIIEDVVKSLLKKFHRELSINYPQLINRL